ncbi:MAG: methionyl-tRNA formyltransferase [bacterium]|nr:methionyl-tRNA formyltransferase [bacterium]
MLPTTNFVFFGTPNFAAIILKKLMDAGLPPSLVICNPDKPVGRKKIVTPPPTKILALNNGIEVFQPENLKNVDYKLKAISYKLAVVAAYSKIIPQEIIDLFPHGIIGVHPSLLPKYRGASPIQQAILDGEKETGVTLYLIDEKVDHGQILVQRKLNYELRMMNYELAEQKLAELGSKLLIETLPKYLIGEIKPKSQDHSRATFTKKFKTEDGHVDLTKDKSEIIARKIRALNPEPGVYTIQNNKRLKLLEVKKVDDKWTITKTQLEGKKPKEDKISLDSNRPVHKLD